MNSEKYCSFIPQRRLQMRIRCLHESVELLSVKSGIKYTIYTQLCPARASVSSEAVAVNLSSYESK